MLRINYWTTRLQSADHSAAFLQHEEPTEVFLRVQKKKPTSFIPIFRNHPGIFDFSFFPGADVSWVETFCCTRTCSEINTPLWEWNHKLLAAQQSRFMTLFTTALLPGLIQTASNNCKHYIEIIAGTKTKVPENTRFCFFYQGLTRLEHRQSYQESLS